MKTCQRPINYDPMATEQKLCGKPAIASAYEPPIYFCEDCLHLVMEDESGEVWGSVKEVDSTE